MLADSKTCVPALERTGLRQVREQREAAGTEARWTTAENPRDEPETSTWCHRASNQTRESEAQVPAGDTHLGVIAL